MIALWCIIPLLFPLMLYINYNSDIGQLKQLKKYHINKEYDKEIELAHWLIENDEILSTEAAAILGDRYYTGDGVEQNYTKAVEYYKRVAENNIDIPKRIRTKSAVVHSMITLGKLHSQGIGVEQNYDKAVEYYNKAIIHSKIYDQIMIQRWRVIYVILILEIMHKDGIGIRQDLEKAKEYYSLAKNLMKKLDRLYIIVEIK